MKKNDIQNEGYDLTKVGNDSLYFNEGSKFIPLSQELHEKITNGTIRLWITLHNLLLFFPTIVYIGS